VKKLDQRIQRSKRSGKLVLGGVFLVSVAFAAVLVQGLFLALEAGRTDLVGRGVFGLVLLLGLNLFSLVLVRRQHRMLDEAREELEELVRGNPSNQAGPRH
jgi:uncharacterized membrane protein